jgi:hypothetical protein
VDVIDSPGTRSRRLEVKLGQNLSGGHGKSFPALPVSRPPCEATLGEPVANFQEE